VSVRRAKVSFSKFIEASVRHKLFTIVQDATTLSADGKVSWAGFRELDEYIETLGDAFVFPPEISRREAATAVWRGILDARKTGKISDSSVLEALQRLTDSRLSESPCRFSMWSRLSYRPPIPSADMQFAYADVSIRLCAELPRYMELSEKDFARLTPIATKDTPGFGFLIASTQARNQTEASDKLFNATELFQAVYNLALKPWNIMGSEQRPEALLLMGPYQFLFRKRKSLLPDSIWFNPAFRDEYWKSSADDLEKLSKRAPSIRKALGKLENHPLREPLATAFLMMNEGMESADMTRRTLRYWTALEQLFQAGDERVAYDRIIRRATYLNDPPDIPRAKLARLMRIRNRYVHMGKSENEHHQLTQYLAEEIRSHLFYLVINGDDFADHGEFIEMTDLPAGTDALQRRRRAIDRRERMMKKRRHRSD
jgi:hypothetical protein